MVKLLYFLGTFLFTLLSFASSSLEKTQQALLNVEIQINNANKSSHCSPSLQNCTIQITKQTGCVQQSGIVIITNKSKITARDIKASSQDPNFISYVTQNNGCPAALPPGGSCSISFYISSSIAFTVNNVLVKGSNTNSMYFNLEAVQCIPLTATLSVSPVSLNFIAGSTSPYITIVNTSSPVAAIAPVPAINVHAEPGSPLSVQSTNCPSSLAVGASCRINFTANSLTSQTVALLGDNTNIINLPVTVLGTIPGAPTYLNSTINNGQVQLTWGAPSYTGYSSITGYVITPYIGTTAQPSVTVGNTLSTSMTIAPGTSYSFSVAAINATGAGLPRYSDILAIPAVAGLVVNPASLALSGQGGGIARAVTVTNVSGGTITLSNVSAPSPALPGSANIISSTCNVGTVLADGDSCAITVDPGATATSSSNCVSGIAPTPSDITITPDVGSSVTAHINILDYGCIYQSGYIFSIDDSALTSSIGGTVVSLNDQAPTVPGMPWSMNGDLDSIWGISYPSKPTQPSPDSSSIHPATLMPSQLNCDGSNDGYCGTNNIVAFYGAGTTYAAGLCYQSNIGGYLGWYLPSMCELGTFNPFGSNLCNVGTTNIQTQLFADSLGNITNGSDFWSTTQGGFNFSASATWHRLFALPSEQNQTGKNFDFGVRCVRSLNN